MAESFVHLHNHSFFSLLDGLSSIKGMVKCASDMGYESLAITDHGSCAGLLQFQNACKDHEKETGKKMKPILGMEAYSAADHTNKDKKEQHHLILLAKNVAGYRNLIKLSSLSFLNGFYYKPRIDFGLLEAHKEGLIVSSACSGGEIPSLILDGKEKEAETLANKFKEVFKDDFYLEIMLHKYFTDKERESLEKRLANTIYRMGKKLGIKVIATQDSHYTHRNDWEAHDVLLSVQTIQSVKNPNRMTFGSDDFYIKPYEQMARVFKGAPDVLSNTVEISEKIENKLIIPSMDLLPKFTLPEGFKTEEDYLKALVITGMKQKGFTSDPVYRERIKMEMNVIIKCGYTKYFLILWDIVNFARTQGIAVGCGRGCFLPNNLVDCKNVQKAISEVKIGDDVLVYDGKYHEVVDKLSYDIDEEIIEIEMEDGRKIACTLDHKIHVKRGEELVWIQAGELTIDDDIYDIRDGM